MLTLQFTPFPTLKTDRLLLRQLAMPGDVEAVFRMRSDSRVLRYIARPPMRHRDEAEAWIAANLEGNAKNESVNWAIAFHAAPGELLGMMGIWKIEADNHRAEIGYSLAFEHWGKGIASEAMAAILEYGWRGMNLHSIAANTDPENIASARVLEKQGFVQEAYFRENCFFDGKYGDSRIFSMLNPNH